MSAALRRSVAITVVFHLQHEVPADWDDELTRFHVEENFCIDNYVTRMQREIDADPTHCKSCNRAEAYVGHLSFGDLFRPSEAT